MAAAPAVEFEQALAALLSSVREASRTNNNAPFNEDDLRTALVGKALASHDDMIRYLTSGEVVPLCARIFGEHASSMCASLRELLDASNAKRAKLEGEADGSSSRTRPPIQPMSADERHEQQFRAGDLHYGGVPPTGFQSAAELGSLAGTYSSSGSGVKNFADLHAKMRLALAAKSMPDTAGPSAPPGTDGAFGSEDATGAFAPAPAKAVSSAPAGAMTAKGPAGDIEKADEEKADEDAEVTWQERQRQCFMRHVFGAGEPPPWTTGDVKSFQALWGIADLTELSDMQVDKLARVLCDATGQETTLANLNKMASQIGNSLYHLEQLASPQA